MKFNRIHLWAILGAALFIRLLSLGAYPLMDTTEARYGEMARLMIETANWITPQFDYNVPFWGKPPLFTWMSAIGIELFGVNEFAVRFPHWLAGFGVLLLMAKFARSAGYSGLITMTVLASCIVFIVSAGAVMTDMALTLGMTLAMIGFYRCWCGEKFWGYLGFIGLAIGLLAKGPLVIVLVGLAVVPWLVIQHGILGAARELWQRFPVFKGTLLMLVIAMPWYILAERATPGFLNYFIVGEHFKRFLVSGWEGDLYGSAHNEARGTIWLFWVYAALPWSLVLPILAWKKWQNIRRLLVAKNGLLSFALLWMISPLIMFTFSGNILAAYVLPGIPALALIISILVSDMKHDPNWFKATASLTTIIFIAALIYIQQGTVDKRSDKIIFHHAEPEIPTYYVGKRPFSGQFYSAGQAKVLEDINILADIKSFQLVAKKSDMIELLKKQPLDCVVEYTGKSRRALYRCKHDD